MLDISSRAKFSQAVISLAIGLDHEVGRQYAGPKVDSINYYAARIREMEGAILTKQQEILQVVPLPRPVPLYCEADRMLGGCHRIVSHVIALPTCDCSPAVLQAITPFL